MVDKAETVIKKYPNRRLYDTSASAYITLEDVRRLVEQKKPVKVVDAKTGEDLTRQTFMQIMLEEESGGAPVFTAEMLAQVISFYGHAQHGSLGPFLDATLRNFVRSADEVAKHSLALKAGTRKQAEAIVAANTQVWADLAKAQQAAMAGVFEQMQKAAGMWMPKAPVDKGSQGK